MKNERNTKREKGRKAQIELQNDTSISSHINGITESFAEKSFRNATSKLKTASTKPDSITEVNLVPAGFAGRRRVVGIRVDENFYRRFKPIAQAYFGSVCRPIEAFMASVIAISEMGVNFGKTIEIGKLVIERNLRTRRRLVVEEEVEVVDRKPNYYNSRVGTWEYRNVEPSRLNEHGHVNGCGCVDCRANKRR